MLINELGTVEVVDRWSEMEQESGVFDYFSATKELGVIPVEVENGGFMISYATSSYLRYEEGSYYFVTPDFYYPEGRLDVELTLTYPPNLYLMETNIEPESQGEGVLHWKLEDVSHQVVIVRFEREGPFAEPGRVGSEWQVNPMGLPPLEADEIPGSADEVLKELENIITVARASKATDPDFIIVLEKLLAKLYYVMSIHGLLLDYAQPDESAGTEVPQDEQSGTVASDSSSVGRR
jgi:hypothetical protein